MPRRAHPSGLRALQVHRMLIVGILSVLSLLAAAGSAVAGERIPGDTWMRYTDVRQAGFDPQRLEAARAAWEDLPSASFLVIVDGAVVADWGDSRRRFMCHSVRKSFLAALYGIYYDRGELELNKTLADLGIDDEPDALLETEKQARILDLLKARSGVFHPAAYAGRTDSRPRGSEAPGRYFAYNNWDFNTLATILMQETGEDVFEAFDRYFAQPLHMQDWRLSDGYYHYERDKSKYPAYPFRMSARDAARVGLLYAREGLWGDERILSRNWVRRCTAEYSIDDEVRGYGFMWWTYREPRFRQFGMVSALGVGNQMIASLPDIDMVIVNRANTYVGERTPTAGLLDLVEAVLEARVGAPLADPALIPVDPRSDPRLTPVDDERLAALVGEWSYPPPSLGLPEATKVTIEAGPGHVVSYVPQAGTFRLYLQEDGALFEEDTHERYVIVGTPEGVVDGIASAQMVTLGAVQALDAGQSERATTLLRLLDNDAGPQATVARALFRLVDGDEADAEAMLRDKRSDADSRLIESAVNVAGYGFLQGGNAQRARQVFALNTRLFPESSNAWDSLGESLMQLGEDEAAITAYQKSLELDPRNSNAQGMIERIRRGGAKG